MGSETVVLRLQSAGLETIHTHVHIADAAVTRHLGSYGALLHTNRVKISPVGRWRPLELELCHRPSGAGLLPRPRLRPSMTFQTLRLGMQAVRQTRDGFNGRPECASGLAHSRIVGLGLRGLTSSLRLVLRAGPNAKKPGSAGLLRAF